MNKLHEAANVKKVLILLWLVMLHYCCLKVQEKFLSSITILYITININDILRMTCMQLKNAHIIGHVKNAKENLRSL